MRSKPVTTVTVTLVLEECRLSLGGGSCGGKGVFKVAKLENLAYV